MTPKFSIAIPVYNRSNFLCQAIASCLAQAVTDFEVIVSDDCSSEDLRAVVQSFGDPRLVYHRAESRLGAAANHQKSVSFATGTYVINLHSDDMLLPSCLEVAGRELDRRPSAAAVYFACTYLDAGRASGGSLLPAMDFADAASLMRHPWLERFHGVGPSCCLFRRAVFDRIGGYRTSLRFAYDWELYSRFLMSGGGVIFLPQILCIYRQHSEQAVQTSSIDGLWDMFDLWPENDNELWSARQLAGLVLTQCGMKLRSPEGVGGILKMLEEIHRRKLARRLLGGLPGALLDKIRARIGGARSDDAQHYIPPLNREAAIEQANMILRTYAARRL
jgi:glycosyltransferase involved in cell wall biosynthesis